MNQHRDRVSPGDRVFFWETGTDACVRAVGRIVSAVYDRGGGNQFGQYGVDVVYESKVEPPLTRDEIIQDPILGKFRPFRWAMGTNIPLDETDVVRALQEALGPRLIGLGDGKTIEKAVDTQKILSDAIRRANRETIQTLRHNVSQMEPTAFEWLIRALLLKLGYTNVIVTKRSGDGGIDVTADLIAGGIADIKTAIQAKRTKTVGRPIVQALRGSLSAHQAGLVITSGRFADSARQDAVDPQKTAIACIDGQKLCELLLEHRIGSERRIVEVYTIRPERLTLAELQAITESDSTNEPSS